MNDSQKIGGGKYLHGGEGVSNTDHDVVGLEFTWLGLDTLRTESFRVDKSSI